MYIYASERGKPQFNISTAKLIKISYELLNVYFMFSREKDIFQNYTSAELTIVCKLQQ